MITAGFKERQGSKDRSPRRQRSKPQLPLWVAQKAASLLNLLAWGGGAVADLAERWHGVRGG